MSTRVANNSEFEADQRFLMGKNAIFNDFVKREQENGLLKTVTCCSDESSSSSIGKNSDVSEGSNDISGDGDEVQSSYKSPLNSIADLEEVLPIKRGISRFYNGRSKSFATLPGVSLSSSIKDIAKPENAYTRRRRNLHARNVYWDKTRNSSHLRSNGGGISKRVTGSSSTTLALAVAMNNFDESDKFAEKESLPLSPIRKDMGCWRSFSFADFQHCVSATNSNQVPTKLS